MTGTTFFAWDGLSLEVPSAWEPARLGLGYALFEDASGPRLTLRWQRQGKPAPPAKVLRRLSRKTFLKPDTKPQGTINAMLSALPEDSGALPCVDASGRGADAVLFTLPGEGTAVLAAPHARPDEKAAPWTDAVRSVNAAPSGRFALYDVAGETPPGFKLAAFKVQLGHYHLQYRSRGGALDYYRFAPAGVLLKGSSLHEWMARTLAGTLGAKARFTPLDFEGREAAIHAPEPAPGPARTMRSLLARLFAQARFTRTMAWRPDASRILAVSAAHPGDLSPATFQEICERYVLRQTPAPAQP